MSRFLSLPLTMPRRLRSRRGEEGQALVVVALSMTVLIGFAAVAVDVGRFMGEKRFLQNVADAAALGAARVLKEGGAATEAEATARAILAANAVHGPNGVTPPPPPLIPAYESGHWGEPRYLQEGILITGSEVRVAVRDAVPHTFGRILGFVEQNVSARARAGTSGGLLPIAVRRYIYPPGPNTNATTPCADQRNRFMAFFATADTACLGSESDASLRAAPSEGAAFDPLDPGSDPSRHGPVVEILGQGAQPNNSSDFRGFLALDIRNFSTTTSRAYYNGVTPGTNANTLKDIEAQWIAAGGYPGPAFPSVVTPPDPNDQVGVLTGNSTGKAIDEMRRWFVPGDEVLVAVYPGSVMSIPDFAMAPPGTIALPTSGTVASAGSFKVSRNQAFSGTVELSTLPDLLDPANPMVTGVLAPTAPITYSPNPVTPSLGNGATVTMGNVTVTGGTPGIYALWVQGHSGSPYLTTKQEPFAVRIGTVDRDFSMNADANEKSVSSAGQSVSFTLELQNSPSRNTSFGGAVTLTVDGPLPAGTGGVSFSSSSVTPTRDGRTTTLTIATGTLPQGAYRFVVRATGMNGDATPRKVTRLLPLTVHVAPAGGGNAEYVDIAGFAVMRLASLDANTVTAYAITPVIADQNDARLRRGQRARLLPW